MHGCMDAWMHACMHPSIHVCMCVHIYIERERDVTYMYD